LIPRKTKTEENRKNAEVRYAAGTPECRSIQFVGTAKQNDGMTVIVVRVAA